MTFFSTSERLEIGDVPFISHGTKPNRSESLEYYRRVAATWKLKLALYESVLSVNRNQEFIIETSKRTIASKAIIIATGFYDIPYLLNIPGEELSKVKHYYDEPHPYFGMDIAVIGASNSAVDVALETYRKGARVTMIVRESEISKSVKYWVKPDVENRIKEGEIKVHFNSQITKIDENRVDVSTPSGNISIINDFVLAMTGYLPDFSFLKSIGIKIGSDELMTPHYNPETMETNVSNVYLAGVICGGLKTNKWFIENSRVHAEVIIKHLARKNSSES